jgi:hypothetical protein
MRRLIPLTFAAIQLLAATQMSVAQEVLSKCFRRAFRQGSLGAI